MSLKAQWSPMKRCVVSSLQHAGWQCVYWVWSWVFSCSFGPVCLSLTLVAASKISTLRKKKLPPQQQKLIQRCWLKGTSAHVFCTQENSDSLTNVNSHNVLNSQVSEKLQVFGTCRNFALYLSVTRLFRAAFIFLSRHTDSFQTQSILRSHYTATKAWAQGRCFSAQLPWRQNIHSYCMEGETPFTSVLTQYHALRLIWLKQIEDREDNSEIDEVLHQALHC